MYYESELYHHGIKGQKWGVRRFQNPDGTLTAAGKRRNIVEARKNLNAEKSKLSELNKKKTRLEIDTEYRDDIHDLRLNAEDSWDYKKNKPLSDKQIDANWNKFDKAYKKALSENKEYQKILKEVESQKVKVKELESLANTKTGRDYTKAVLGGLGAISAASAGMILVDYLMSHK